ncbi:MAG TPA: LLM class flavin-dependent oxidoreductase [Actinomycetota bacterium]
MAVRVGIGLFTGQLPEGSPRTFAQEYRDTIELVRLAERAGFDSAWVSEHHGSSDGYLPSLFVMLGAITAATERIALGTGVILTPLHDPIRLAEDAAVVDQLSGGRLVVGLGLGWREEEFRMLGVPFEERLARHVDTVEILRRAWTGERFSFEGRVFRYDRVRVTPPPARPGGPPILLGGYADAALRRAGRLGDGHLTDGDEPDALAHAVALVDEGARSAGKDPGGLRLVLMRNAFVVEEGDAWAAVRAGVVHQWGAYDAWARGDDTPARDRLDAVLEDDDVARRATDAGTPAAVAERLTAAVAPWRGRDVEVVVRLHYPGMDLEPAARAVALFGEHVLPALRGA